MTRRDGRRRYVTTPLPRDVPAFDRAKVEGLTPRVPPTPPPVSVTPTARRALRDVAVVIGLGVATILVTLLIAVEDGRLSWPAVAALLGVSGVVAVALAAAVRRWGRAQIGELQRAYTTCTFTAGRFWVAAPLAGTWSTGRVQWDWDATWVLRDKYNGPRDEAAWGARRCSGPERSS